MTTTTAPISLPKVCCRCAQKQGNHSWKITSSQQRVTGYYVVAYSTRTTTISFDVSVCDSCYQELKNIDSKSTLLIVASIILGAIIMPIWIGDPKLGLLFIISGGCGGWFIGYIISLIYKSMSGYNLISFDGKQLDFNNQEYQKQFLMANPNLPQNQAKREIPHQISASPTPVKKLATEHRDWVVCSHCGTKQHRSSINCNVCKSVFEK